MILAIFILILVALGGVMILGNASIGGKTAGDNYFHLQTQLLADSATEFAVMQAQGQQCLSDLNITVQDDSGSTAYDVDVKIKYAFEGVANPACTAADILATNTGNRTTMLVDTTVTCNIIAGAEQIRVTKRTWQKL